MIPLRADLLEALGIHCDAASKYLVLRGKLYERGPSFARRDKQKAAQYCQKSEQEGLSCLLVESSTELTVWLEISNSKLTSTLDIQPSQVGSGAEQLPQPSSQRVALSYHGA
ncbi:MAG: hypothetical protein QNJ46_09675 [Leptolyngbyaceae cyanobacterium MO_188.B28]|nr:hypothetical protein [Leptolyngbyaceae cyanobacterium MO_188.B28]